MGCDTYIYKKNAIEGTQDYILFHLDTIRDWNLGEALMLEMQGTMGEVIGDSLKAIFDSLKIEPSFKIKPEEFYQIEISY